MVSTILKNMSSSMGEFVNGKDDIPSLKWKIKHVWNHQPVDISSFPNLIPQSFLGLPILGQGLSDNKKVASGPLISHIVYPIDMVRRSYTSHGHYTSSLYPYHIRI